jgi:hypothetical protein
MATAINLKRRSPKLCRAMAEKNTVWFTIGIDCIKLAGKMSAVI